MIDSASSSSASSSLLLNAQNQQFLQQAANQELWPAAADDDGGDLVVVLAGVLRALHHLGHAAQVHATTRGAAKWTALVIAASRSDLVEALLAANVKARLLDDSATPLSCAATWQEDDDDDDAAVASRFLLQHDAVRIVVDLAPHTGPYRKEETPLDCATQGGHAATAQALRQHGKGAHVNAMVNVRQGTPLRAAAQKGWTAVMELLIQHGADLNAVNQDGASPLFVASAQGHVNVVQCLIDAGANINTFASTTTTAADGNGKNKSARMTLFRLILLAFIAAVMPITSAAANDRAGDNYNHSYMLLGVSGGLQDGFPDHIKLDYAPEQIKAIFIGKALVRGTKAYLDVMQQGWRQYTTPESGQQPLINANVVVSGCHEHANEYWIYAVDTRQVLAVLNNEPRFLSITPDTALVDLTSFRTSNPVRAIAHQEIEQQGYTNLQTVALPIVVSTWYNAESYVPSPAVATLEDGTTVTNFEESLALWAGVNNDDRTCGLSLQQAPQDEDCVQAQGRYWQGVHRAIRQAEKERRVRVDNGPPFDCQAPARLGVSPDMARINYPFKAQTLVTLFANLGYQFDIASGTLEAVGDNGKDEM